MELNDKVRHIKSGSIVRVRALSKNRAIVSLIDGGGLFQRFSRINVPLAELEVVPGQAAQHVRAVPLDLRYNPTFN